MKYFNKLILLSLGLFIHQSLVAQLAMPPLLSDCAGPDTNNPVLYANYHKQVSVVSVDSNPANTNNDFTASGDKFYTGTTNNPANPVYSGPYVADIIAHFFLDCGGYEGYTDGAGTAGLADMVNDYINDDMLDDGVKSVDEHHTGTGWSVQVVTTNDTQTITYNISLELLDPYKPSHEANDGQDPGAGCSCQNNPDGVDGGDETPPDPLNPIAETAYGMPSWSITEPYINLWVHDIPVSYTTSLGKKIDFKVSYKQRDTRPMNTSVPPTGWSHNWFSYVHFVVPTYLSSTNSSLSNIGTAMPGPTGPFTVHTDWLFTNDFSQWQAIVYATDDSENYFSQTSTTETRSGLQLISRSGGTTNGFLLVHGDGSVDEYAIVSSPSYSFGITRQDGRIYDAGTKAAKFTSFGIESAYDTGGGNYVENTADEDTPAPVGEQVGYVACDALLTARVDPYGNRISLSYTQSGTNYYLHTITDYDGQLTTLAYDTNGMVTNVSMPYGKSASFVYGGKLLSQITDAQGMSSSFDYSTFSYVDQSDSGENIYLSSLTTPYGTTSFSHYEAPPALLFSNPPTVQQVGVDYVPYYSNGTSLLHVGWFGGTNRVNKACTVTYPDGTHELYLYRYDSRGLVPSSYPTNQVPGIHQPDDGTEDPSSDPDAFDYLLSSRNSFHWNRQQYPALSTNDFNQFTAADYKLATMQHWLETDATETFYPQASELNVSDQASLIRQASPDGIRDGSMTWIYHGNSDWLVASDAPSFNSYTLLPNGEIGEHDMTFNSDGRVSSVSDSYTTSYGNPELRTTAYDYGATVTTSLYSYNRLTGISVPNGAGLTLYYPSDLEIDQVSDLGDTTSYFYNSRHQLTGIKHANGLTTTNLYDGSGFLSQTIDLESKATNTYTFAHGLPATRTTPLGLTLNYFRDGLDRLTGLGFSDGTTVSNIYDKLNIVAHKDQLNHWTYASFDNMRQPASTTDARGGVTYYSFCFCGGLESLTDPSGSFTTYSHDYAGNVIEKAGSDGFVTDYHCNLLGQVTNLTTTAGLNLNYFYNNQGLATNVVSSAGTLFAALYDVGDRPEVITDAQGVSVTNSYDTLDRLTYRHDAHGTVQNNYDAQGIFQHYDALSHLTSYGYDPAGRLASVIDANGNTNSFTYNPLGQIATLTDGNGHVTAWAYDPHGRTTGKVDGNNILIETNGYDANGWLTAHWTPAKGLTRYTNDPNGNVTGVTYSSGPGITAAYDALNQITTMSDAVGSSTFTYTNFGAFNEVLKSEDGPWASDTMTYGYNHRLPQSLSLAQPSGSWSESFTQDGMQRLHTLVSSAGTFTYAYNGAGRQVSTLTLPGSGNEIDYAYDGAGAVSTTALKHGGTALDSSAYTYDGNGNRTSLTRADNASVNYGYDAIGQLVSAVGQEASSLLRANENFGYGYDPAGNLVGRTNNTLIQSFNTDGANQLLNVTRNNDLLTVAGSLVGSNSFTINGQATTIYHDLTFAVTNGISIVNGLNTFTAIATSNSVAMTNQLLEMLPATVSLGYDANGNLVSDGVHGYDYDCANQLSRITVTNILKTEFNYDGLGRRRIRKDYAWQTNSWAETNEVHYVYDGALVIQERASNNIPLVSYTRGLDLSGSMQGAGGIGGLLARTDGSGTAFYHADGNGNVTMLMDSSGNQLAKYLYDSFGNTLGMWGTLTSANTYRFSSKEIDANSGLYYFGFRFYEPNLQRWLNRDPIEEVGGINLYGFVENNSLRYLDLLGLAGCEGELDPDEDDDEGGLEEQKRDADQLETDRAAMIARGRNPNVTYLDPAPGPTRPMNEEEWNKTLGDLLKMRENGRCSIIYSTYTKPNPVPGGRPYWGRTRGTGTPEENVAARDRKHDEKNAQGFGPARLDKSSKNYDAIRGREQQGIESSGGAQSQGGTSPNIINGVAPSNPNAKKYNNAANDEFGPID